MPGVVMDNVNVGGAGQEPGIHESKNGLSNPGGPGSSTELRNGTTHVNGVSGTAGDQLWKTEASAASGEPPELVHITQGFFPFSMLVNRSVQQCWNDLSELIAELAEIQVPYQDQSSLSVNPHGKSSGNQTSANVQKKLRLLDFAHAKRAEFIKLLVLSQWSRQAADVSQLIDLQGFIRTRHQAYAAALQWVGDMKRDLVMAQVANPDLKTALEVLSKGRVMAMSDLGYKPPKPLTAKRTLKKLQKLNKIISIRLTLNDQVPRAFQTYRVHDGRVTFSVPGEFELDLSVGEENKSSQFFFVDIRFLFSPSSAIPKGRVLNELDIRINDVLRDSGLTGCFDLLHSLVLTFKVNVLFKQAIDLARGLWSDVLRVELLHRTLIVQYWALKPGAKSWLEVGIKSGRQRGSHGNPGVPCLGLRWMRDGQEVDSADIEFDTQNLSMECVLRSVIALHVSHILSSVYTSTSENSLFSMGTLSLYAQLSRMEPGDCQLDIQLTSSRRLRVTVEPMSGASVLSATPSILDRFDSDRGPDKSLTDEIASRVARIRCSSAIEEIESNLRILGFETVNPRSLKVDIRRIFPSNIIRFTFFRYHLWEPNWLIAATSSMDSDNWWVIQLRPTLSANKHPTLGAHNTSMLRSAQVISSRFLTAQQHTSYAACADLGHCLTGILAIHANARFLVELQCIHFHPPLHKLQIETGLRTPDIFIRYEASDLPPALRIAQPAGLKKSYIKNTIRVAFHGIDPHKNLAILVAYGSLSMPVKSLGTLVSKWDPSIVFRQKGGSFAIRLLAPAGQVVIVDLIEKLQRLERILSIIESLQRKKMDVLSLSLSRIAFSYGPGKALRANINVSTFGPSSSADTDLAGIPSKTDSVFLQRLGIAFDYPNPHRRIQESLTTSLNNASSEAGLDSFFELLTLTLPLLRALDQITVNPPHNEPLKVQITVRNAKTYQIHYPVAKFRFQLVVGQHLNRMTWILKDVSGTQDRSHQGQITGRLQEKLYNAKGDGWRGLGTGVVADVDKVSNLILELDGCFSDSRSTIATPGHSAVGHGTRNVGQQQAIGQGDPRQTSKAGVSPSGGVPAVGAPGREPEQKASDDVIMID